jgi:exosortase A-associated hydrolase 2
MQYGSGRPSTDRRAMLVLPPFAEEMNKSRRMMALAAEAYCATGRSALIVDLYGTGDSEGDFRESSVGQWFADLCIVMDWLAGEGFHDVDVLAVRAGALFFPPECTESGLCFRRLALWQPVSKGKQVVSQFLRLRNAGAIVGKAQQSESDPKTELQESGYVEIAGYDLSRTLVDELTALDLADVLGLGWESARWFDIVAGPGAGLTPAASRTVAMATGLGIAIDARAVPGDPFWATPEIAEVPQLVEETMEFFE